MHPDEIKRPCPEVYIDGFGRPLEYQLQNPEGSLVQIGDLRGTNTHHLRDNAWPYDGSIYCFVCYLSAARTGAHVEKAARACNFCKALEASEFSFTDSF